MQHLDKSDIEVLAYYIWEKLGRPEGRALEHWLEAEYLYRTQSFVTESEPDAAES
jgi:hypothetical protein